MGPWYLKKWMFGHEEGGGFWAEVRLERSAMVGLVLGIRTRMVKIGCGVWLGREWVYGGGKMGRRLDWMEVVGEEGGWAGDQA